MSFAGGTGHKSPFGERAKSTKSPLSVKRNGSVGVSRAAQRGVRHSLFAREPPTSSPTAKVGQWRSAQAEVNEPTTPTKLSEGGVTDTFRRERAAGREDFSKFPKGKVVTPVKTLKPAFGSTPPRSPKRPYLRSPKCQKVLLERPAFYNVPADGLKIDPPNKEVTIAELQERLKKFLGEENALRRSQEGPFTICLSPNPLYRYDSLPAATEDNGAVKAEQQEVVASETEQDELPPDVDASSSACLEAAMESHISVDDFTEINSTESDGSENPVEIIDPTVQFEESLIEEHPILEEERIEGDNAVESCDSAADSVIPEATEISQDSSSSVPEHSNLLVEDESKVDKDVTSTLPETIIGETEAVVRDSQQAPTCVSESSSGDSSEKLVLESGIFSRISAADNSHESEVIHHGSNVETDSNEEFDEELQVSWTVRLVKFLLSAIMVTCLMGAVVLGSGSPGLLPKSLHSNPLAMKWAEVMSTPALSAKLIPTSVGIMGLGTEIDDIPFLQPLVTQAISRVFSIDAAKIEGFASTYFNGSPLLSLLGKDTGVVVESNPVGALDQLQIATDHFKDLRGKLFSNVAALTDTKTSGSKDSETSTTVVSRTEESAEVEHSAFAAKSLQTQNLNTCQWSEHLMQDLLAPEGPADQSDAAKTTSSVSRTDSVLVNLQAYEELNGLKEADVSAPEEAFSLSAVDDNTISSMGFDSEARISVGDEVLIPTEGTVEVSSPRANPAYNSLEEVDMRSSETVDDLLKYVDELFNPVLASDSSLRMPEWKSDAVSSLETHQNDMSLLSEGIPPVAVIGILVAALAGAGLFVLSTRNTLPDTAGLTSQKIATSLVSPLRVKTVAKETLDKKSYSPPHSSTSPTTYSVHDTHIPDKHQLGAMSSPFSSFRAQRNFGVQNLSTRFEMAELPTCSAPAVHVQSMSRVEEETSSVSVQTWHHPARIQEEYATKPFSYRQTATYVPSYSGMSTSWSAGETNSVAESALSTGADYNDLGSFTTSELISINEGGEEQKRMTPVRRSQRIRNKAVSPSPKLIF